VSRRAGTAVAGCVAALGVGYLAVVYFAPWWLKRPSPAPPSLRMLPEGDYPTGALAVDNQTPPLEAKGWVNGGPHFEHSKLIVVDIWAAWCPFCRATAPGLVQTQEKFKERGVAFVSLTMMPENSVQEFVTAHGVLWPAGYGASPATIARFGAYNQGAAIPGYEVAPTLYIIDADGKVLWSDGQGRYRHEDPDALIRRLETALEEQLARY
jgi:thiol-disulfide isomerase/thioredoxin